LTEIIIAVIGTAIAIYGTGIGIGISRDANTRFAGTVTEIADTITIVGAYGPTTAFAGSRPISIGLTFIPRITRTIGIQTPIRTGHTATTTGQAGATIRSGGAEPPNVIATDKISPITDQTGITSTLGTGGHKIATSYRILG
jgi:hypothetical protein